MSRWEREGSTLRLRVYAALVEVDVCVSWRGGVFVSAEETLDDGGGVRTGNVPADMPCREGVEAAVDRVLRHLGYSNVALPMSDDIQAALEVACREA